MAVQAKAKGNGPATGMPKQPRPSPPNQVTNVRAPSRQNYGENGPNNPSSAPIGAVQSDLSANLRASSDDGENVLDTIIERGSRMGNPDFQTRVVDDKGYPAAFGMRNRSGEK